MRKKINVLTLLIFVYSIVICLTCNRDFSGSMTKRITPGERFLLVNNVIIRVSTKQPVVFTSPVEKQKNN